MWLYRFRSIFVYLIVTSLLTQPFNMLHANSVDTLRRAIQGREQDIDEIDKEIKQLEVQVDTKRQERQTLQQTVNQIASQQSQLEARIASAESNVNQLETQIAELSQEIAVLEESILSKRNALKNNLQLLQINSGDTLVEGLLKYKSLSEYWQQTEGPRQLGQAIDSSMDEIRDAKVELDEEIARQEAEQARIVALQQQIMVDKESVDIAKAEQERLLGITKNQEANYQALLQEKQELRSAFEADLATYENQLNITLNPASIPQAASSTLSWPLSNVVITQYFGNTAFAASGAYNGSGHNGIDLDLEVGTPVLAARQGTIRATGNTDRQCPYASYGKWILIEHDNGLSTLYAHLSSIGVSSGQAVTRGQVIGYGGNTGYSTGSHLHFTVYATEGVRVDGLPSRSCPGTNIILPLADLSAYLNPMQYLP